MTKRARGTLSADVAAALPAKWEAKGLEDTCINAERLAGREAEFRADWERNLSHLLPAAGPREFDSAWKGTLAFVRRLIHAWPIGRST